MKKTADTQKAKASSPARSAMVKKSAPRNKPKDLSDLFLHGLKDIYYAEKKIYKALPKMIKAAEAEELANALSNHRDETQQHITRLEQVFELMGKTPKGEKCDAIDGILEESESILEDFGETKACDAAIIFSAQAVEHYEITRYGSLHAFAKVLGHGDAAELLGATLAEEEAADKGLSDLAEERINYAASEYEEEAGGNVENEHEADLKAA